MKKKLIIACLPVIILLAGCYKDKTDTATYTVPFTILDGLSGVNLKVVTSNNRTPFNRKSTIYFYGDDGVKVTGLWTFGLSGKEATLIQVYIETDTLKPAFAKLIEPVPGLIHNLLVSGTPEAPRYLYLDDHPAAPTDSSTGIRFVNLSPDISDVSINIAGDVQGTEVANLPYMSVSAFKKYSAKTGSNQFVFEMVDKSTGEVVFTYPFITVPFTNTNICLRGLKGRWPELMVTSLYQ